MPEKTSAAANPVEASDLPQPITPIDGAVVDVKAIPFEWTGIEGDVEYLLQIARDSEFEDPVVTVSAGETTAATLYHTLDDHVDTDLHWRVRAGRQGAWGAAASFHAAGAQRVSAEYAERDRAAREAARASLRRHLEGEHRMPVVLPEKRDSDRTAAIVLAVFVISFIILLIVLFAFGQVTYPAEAQL